MGVTWTLAAFEFLFISAPKLVPTNSTQCTLLHRESILQPCFHKASHRRKEMTASHMTFFMKKTKEFKLIANPLWA